MNTFARSALALVALVVTATATATAAAPARHARATYVLVHGAFADHHAFDAVTPLLEARGATVLAPDLPGHGADTTDAHRITLDTYVDRIAAVVAAQPRPVVLVGHSMAGMIVSAVAERVPAKVRALVYVAAYLPRDGESLQELAATDSASLIGRNLKFAPDFSTCTLAPEAVVPALAADLPEPLQRLVAASQRPEPLAPFQGKVHLTPARFGRVPKRYVRTSLDRAVTSDLQTRMLTTTPGVKVVSMTTGHLPFLAKPQEWVGAIR